MVVVDTNVLVYAVDRRAPEHEKCRALLDRLRGSVFPWYTTWGILYEFLRVVTHPQVFTKPLSARRAWSVLEAVLDSPSHGVLMQTERHRPVAALTVKEVPALRGNLFHDAHTAILMREHGIHRLYTRDTDFHRFPFLEVLDPLREA